MGGQLGFVAGAEVPHRGSSWQAGEVDDPEDPESAATSPGVTLVPDPESEPVMRLHRPALADVPQLVEAAQDGDGAAFDELVRRTHADTYTLARRLVSNDDDASDVVQETYLRAFRSIGKFRGDAKFSTWLYRITANCASTHLGRRRRHRHDDLDDELDLADPKPDNDPVLAADGRLLRDQLEAALSELPPKLRAVVVLRDIYDLNHAEIAAELDISESAAKVRLHRARRRLRTQVFPLAGEQLPVEPEEHAHAV